MIESSVHADTDVNVKKKCIVSLLHTYPSNFVDLPYQSPLQKVICTVLFLTLLYNV